MINFFKNIKDYAMKNNKDYSNTTIKFKKWCLNLIEIPKWTKFLELDEKTIVKKFLKEKNII